MNRFLLLTLMMVLAVGLSAQDAKPAKNTDVELGDGDGKTTVVFALKALGSNEIQKGFKLLVVGKTKDRESLKSTGFTNENGKFRIKLKQDFIELRVFAFGEYVIADTWSNIPLSKLSPTDNNELAWDAFVRPLQDVKITGKVKTSTGTQVRRTYIYFAPLDVKPNGERHVLDSPYTGYIEEDGSYEQVLPTGYYQVWCTFHDRSKDKVTNFFTIVHQVDLFGAQSLDLTLTESPTIEGTVIDARTGKGIAARIDFYSNRYLKRVHIPTADGEFADDNDKDGNEIFWPVGSFKNMSMFGLDPDDFMVVIRPRNKNNVIRTITGLSIKKLAGEKIVWEIYRADSSKVEVTVKTKDGDLPVYQITVGFVPVKVDIPVHLKGEYSANGSTDENGKVKMLGLIPGTYEVYGARVVMLGEIVVKPGADVQKFVLKFGIPLLTGQVKLPDGTVCKNLLAEFTIVDSGMFPNYVSPFRSNKLLQKKGTIFMPLQSLDVTIEVRFLAMKDGVEFSDDEWRDYTDFVLVTDKVQIKVESEKAYKVDLKLKANPDFKKRED